MAGHRRSYRGTSKRETSWLDLPPTAVQLGAASSSLFLQLTTAEKAKRPFTIERTHLTILVTSDQQIATETQIGAFGACVVSDQAAAIGITAIPTPIIDLASDLWFLHEMIFNDFTFATAASYQASAGRVYTIDSHGKRKVNDDQDIVFVGEASTISDGLLFTIGGRLLIKEH